MKIQQDYTSVNSEVFPSVSILLLQVIQDLRRQYSGSIPLIKQEKLSQNLISINLEKQKVNLIKHVFIAQHILRQFKLYQAEMALIYVVC